MKRFFKILGILGGLFLLYLGGMIGYAMLTDYAPDSPKAFEVQQNPALSLDQDTLTILNWNIGFCGLGKESDFFYDGGEMVHMPEEIVRKNLDGVLSWLDQQADQTDFFLLQEVDKASSRSYDIDQVAAISAQLPQYGQAYGTNYKVGFIPIPLTDPLGSVHSGVSSWSRFHIGSATRYPFKGNYEWPTYLFFLDRCYLVLRYPMSDGKELVLINTHNSAYDDGTLKEQQMQQMSGVLLEEYEKGNYVIVGGDWNQFPPNFTGVGNFPMNKTAENDKLFVSDDYPAPDWQWAFDPTIPTNRSLTAAFNADTTYRTVIDFFLVSPNVEVLAVQGVNLEFEFSDHNPVRARFRLIPPYGTENPEKAEDFISSSHQTSEK